MPFGGSAATHDKSGNLNNFIENVLVEVVTENYRQLMSEAIIRSEGDDGAMQLDPPLRANERILSGLFSNAISRVAPRSRPEARIDRIRRPADDENSDDNDSPSSAGRVDYLAWYGNRVVAVELKAGRVNVKNPTVTSKLQERWNGVNDQAQTAQTTLRARQKEDRRAYPSPISMALMVVVAQSKVSLEEADLLDNGVVGLRDGLAGVVGGLNKRPQFIATYTFPPEFRRFALRERGVVKREENKCSYIPFVSFMGRVAVNKR